jgi:hypothetical protein
MMEASHTSETSVKFLQAVQRYNPEDSHLGGRHALYFKITLLFHVIQFRNILLPWLLKHSHKIEYVSLYRHHAVWTTPITVCMQVKDLISSSVTAVLCNEWHYSSCHKIACFKATARPPSPLRAAVSQQRSVASFTALRVLSYFSLQGSAARVAMVYDFDMTLKHAIWWWLICHFPSIHLWRA